MKKSLVTKKEGVGNVVYLEAWVRESFGWVLDMFIVYLKMLLECLDGSTTKK
jgi:hypothetical protein